MYSYDAFAENYDSFYSSPECDKEDHELVYLIRKNLEGNTLDVGSGTGWLLDKMYFDPVTYTGVDVSLPMTDVCKRKHPTHQVIHGSVLDCNGQYGTIMAIYGVFSYMTVQEVEHLANLAQPNAKCYFMAYRPGYHPTIVTANGIKPPSFDPDDFEAKEAIIRRVFPEVYLQLVFNKYLVLTNFK